MIGLKINSKACHGANACDVLSCEDFLPGIHIHLEEHGVMLISDSNYVSKHRRINEMILKCPASAISVSDYDE